ncbi:MAG: hypothetical protein PUD63_04410, partial [Clostridia bacterium]|nr:hypothetical protein [Clostridia bacterium]
MAELLAHLFSSVSLSGTAIVACRAAKVNAFARWNSPFLASTVKSFMAFDRYYKNAHVHDYIYQS